MLLFSISRNGNVRMSVINPTKIRKIPNLLSMVVIINEMRETSNAYLSHGINKRFLVLSKLVVELFTRKLLQVISPTCILPA